jgi:hypothetical protein
MLVPTVLIKRKMCVSLFKVTLPGEGKDRVFRVSIKWVAQVSLFALEEALEGRTRQIPFDAILVSRK